MLPYNNLQHDVKNSEHERSELELNKKIKLGICQWCIPANGGNEIKLAREIGYSAITLDFERFSDKDPFILNKKIEGYLNEAKLQGVSLTTLAINNFCSLDMTKEENYLEVISLTDTFCDTANKLGVKLLQIPNFGVSLIRTKSDFLNTVKVLKYITKKAEEFDILVGTENALDGENNLKLLELVDEKNLKIIFDTANPLISSNMNAPEILEKIKDYVCEVHLKDVKLTENSNKFEFVKLGSGEVDFVKSIEILKNMQFSGWLNVENEYSSQLLKEDIKYINNYFNK